MEIGPREYHADLLWDRVINGTLYRFVNLPERVFVFRADVYGILEKVHQWHRLSD